MSTFSTLPLELRLLIFHFATQTQSTPKIHSITPSKLHPETFLSNQPIPTLLHTCHTSRVLYLSTCSPTFAYGTYINFAIDTIYLMLCPTSMTISTDGCGYQDGFTMCKALGRDPYLKDRVRKLAVNDTFWLRSSQLERSMAVETWNMVIKGSMRGLEELTVVFHDEKEVSEKEAGMWETVGWYRDGGLGVKQRRCDDFLRVYLGCFPAEKRVLGMRIRYVVVS